MKINRSFAPLTISIETKEDQELILKTIDLALQEYTNSTYPWGSFGRKLYEDSFYQKLQYIRKGIV